VRFDFGHMEEFERLRGRFGRDPECGLERHVTHLV
jgi:hypothetical protein